MSDIKKAKITKYIISNWQASKKVYLVKSFALDDDKKLIKKNPGIIFDGTAVMAEVDLAGLQSGLSRLTKNSCIGLGNCGHDEIRITTKKNDGKKGKLARTKDNFKFYQNEPAFIYFDMDHVAESPTEALKILETVVPGLNQAGKLIVYSSSSMLKNADGDVLNNSTSAHIYILIDDGSDAIRFVDTVFDKLALAGHGHIELSAAPSMLKRGLIDRAVSGPERLIYEGQPILSEGITQDRPAPLLITGGSLDTSQTKTLTNSEKEQLIKTWQDLKELKLPSLDKKVVSKASVIAKKQNISQEKAIEIVKQHQKHNLDPDLILHFKERGELSVKDALERGASLHYAELADPLDPGYDGGSLTKAKFYYNDGMPVIYSQAHGGITYKFVGESNENKKDKSVLGDGGNTGDDIMSMMLERFVYMRNGNKMIDLRKPPQHAMMRKEEFVTAFATLGVVSSGDNKPVKATTAFFSNKLRKAVVGERYHPGESTLYAAEAVNWFNSYFSPKWDKTEKETKITIIKEHLDYLFPGDQQKRFLNWLAWTVCKPDIRIKFTPLLISTHHGTGRGFIDELIKKLVGIWNTSSVNMPTLSGQSNEGQYHNYLYESVFCSMPEVRVDRADAFQVDDAIRSKLTEGYLPMNLKYGTNGTYPCFANFLMASNHKDALILDKEDRRIDVFEHFGEPLEEKYYDDLYATLEDENVMSQFFYYLKRITETYSNTFNPMGRAILSQAKLRMIGGTTNTVDSMIDYIIKNEARDVLRFVDIISILIEHVRTTEIVTDTEAISKIEENKKSIAAFLRNKITKYHKKVKIDGVSCRLYIFRNHEKWVNANQDLLVEEVAGGLVPF